MNLLGALAHAIEEKEIKKQAARKAEAETESVSASVSRRGMKSARRVADTREVAMNTMAESTVVSATEKKAIQLNQFPVSIDARQFSNARSNANPQGDLKTLYRFQQLVDPVPTVGRAYVASAQSTERIYGNIVNHANVASENDWISSIIHQAQQDYDLNIFSDTDGTPGQWRPVYAVPDDWYAADDSRFDDLTIDMNHTSPGNTFQLMPGAENPAWVLDEEHQQTKTLHADTKIKAIHMKYMLVTLKRPWFNPLLFKMGGWYLRGMPPGFCSSGSMEENEGVFPLIPTSMIIGKEFDIDADWQKEDQEVMEHRKASNGTLSLGPFSVSASSTLHVVGWISELIPFSPQNVR